MSDHLTYYDELMLNCLKVTGYNRKEAVKLFKGQFPNLAWMQTYAYKVYERVIEGIHDAPSMKKMASEMINHLRVANEATLERGIQTGDWNPFIRVNETQATLLGADKQPLNVNIGGQHLNISRPPEEIAARIKEIESAITGLSGTGGVPSIAGGVSSPQQSQPPVDIQASRQAGNSLQ